MPPPDSAEPTVQPPSTWVLLIYTVPADPSRKRAFIWRELKKAGAVYLRDGVCVLPQREETVRVLTDLVAKVHEFGGRATLIQHAALDDERAAEVIAEAQADRAAEYGEVQREAQRFLEHAQREREHREFSYPEVEEVAADLGKLKRWAAQVRARDYFGVPVAAEVDALLTRCEEALRAFLDSASAAALEQEEASM